MKSGHGPSPAHLLGLFILSAAMLALEVLLLRVFQYSHWHHFAGLVISLALLGLGAAGTLLALLGPRPAVLDNRWFTGNVLIMTAGMMALLVLQSRVALRPMLAGWDGGELARLLLLDAVAFIPFLGAGLVLGHAFLRWPHHPRRVYSANLLGSGAGSAAASLALLVVDVERAIALICVVLALLALGLATVWRQRGGAGLAAALALVAIVLAGAPPQPALSDFKPLARLLDLPRIQVLDSQPGLRGHLKVLRSDSLRVAPGLSLNWPEPVAAMDAAVIGSERVVMLPRSWTGRGEHLAGSLAGLPLLLRPHARVLSIGAGSWGPTGRRAANAMIWIEADSRIHDLARARGATAPRLEAVSDSAYGFLAASGPSYDIIALDRVYEGGDPAGEDYLLTSQGLTLALSRLGPEGLLVVPMPLHYPPRHYPRMLATLRAALARSGVGDAGSHVAVLRGLRAIVVLASPRPLPGKDLSAIRSFAARWSFDLVWLPDLRREEANQHHLLEAPVFFDTTRAVLRQGELPPAATRFLTDAAHLDRPYFWRSLKWSEAPALLRQMGRRGWSYLDWTLVVSLATTITVVVLGFLLILAPLGRLPGAAFPGRGSVVAFFAALGIGYMLLEMVIFQRTMLFLGEPVLCASVVFAAFMLGSGIGSASAPRSRSRAAVIRSFAALATGGAIAVAGLWAWTDALIALSLPVRMVLVVALIAPLAFTLGRPFPWALRLLAGSRHWVPWAWGINGFASVFAASFAPLLSVHAGHSATLLAAAGCYAAALAVALRWTSVP